MGCDIHLFTERKRTVNGIEKWVNIDNWRLNPYFGNDKIEQKYNVNSLYKDRNYTLFSKLANVRNYHDNPFVSEPKGLPDDVSEEVKKESDYWDVDGHSHSYFTLSELKEFFKKNGIVKHSGFMNPECAKLVDNGQMPKSWWQGGNVPDQVYREWEYEDTAFKNLIELIDERKKDEFWCFGENKGLEYDDKIRIVFWFDN